MTVWIIFKVDDEYGHHDLYEIFSTKEKAIEWFKIYYPTYNLETNPDTVPNHALYGFILEERGVRWTINLSQRIDSPAHFLSLEFLEWEKGRLNF